MVDRLTAHSQIHSLYTGGARASTISYCKPQKLHLPHLAGMPHRELESYYFEVTKPFTQQVPIKRVPDGRCTYYRQQLDTSSQSLHTQPEEQVSWLPFHSYVRDPPSPCRCSFEGPQLVTSGAIATAKSLGQILLLLAIESIFD